MPANPVTWSVAHSNPFQSTNIPRMLVFRLDIFTQRTSGLPWFKVLTFLNHISMVYICFATSDFCFALGHISSWIFFWLQSRHIISISTTSYLPSGLLQQPVGYLLIWVTHLVVLYLFVLVLNVHHFDRIMKCVDLSLSSKSRQ